VITVREMSASKSTDCSLRRPVQHLCGCAGFSASPARTCFLGSDAVPARTRNELLTAIRPSRYCQFVVEQQRSGCAARSTARALQLGISRKEAPPASAGGHLPRPACTFFGGSYRAAARSAKQHGGRRRNPLGSQGLRSNFSRNALKCKNKNEGCPRSSENTLLKAARTGKRPVAVRHDDYKKPQRTMHNRDCLSFASAANVRR